ncbi:MAG: hypothetical protein M1514_00565 [Patescibacteria group bacterium]|nr:hypothetical protein [Patescibacteria group bacterium]
MTIEQENPSPEEKRLTRAELMQQLEAEILAQHAANPYEPVRVTISDWAKKMKMKQSNLQRNIHRWLWKQHPDITTLAPQREKELTIAERVIKRHFVDLAKTLAEIGEELNIEKDAVAQMMAQLPEKDTTARLFAGEKASLIPNDYEIVIQRRQGKKNQEIRDGLTLERGEFNRRVSRLIKEGLISSRRQSGCCFQSQRIIG